MKPIKNEYRQPTEACCPWCEEWSKIEWQDEIPPGGYWWKDSCYFPKCGETVIIETECDMR